MIYREKYLNKLIQSKENGFPKIITGIRRCGKSFLLTEIFKNYLLQEKIPEDQIIIIELDAISNFQFHDPLLLNEYIENKTNDKDKKYYVILDEIQEVDSIINPIYTNGKHILATKKDKNVISFVDIILGLSKKKNIDLYVTGSNSKMLSKDIKTQFRDKATEIKVLPLSFKEFYSYKELNKDEAIREYFSYGGMPLCVLKKNNEDKEIYLKNLFETTYFKDILDKKDLNKRDSLDELCFVLSQNIGNLINSQRLSNFYKTNKHEDIDSRTIEKIIEKFKDSMIIDECPRKDIKGNKIIGSTKKYYYSDIGLRNAKLNFAYPDKGQVMENIIYNDLIYKDYNVTTCAISQVLKNSKKESVRTNMEIDFFASKGKEDIYIQSCLSLDDAKVKAREERPFNYLRNYKRKMIVVMENIGKVYDEKGYEIIGIFDFLINFK